MRSYKVVIPGLEGYDTRAVRGDGSNGTERGWVVIVHGTCLRMHQHPMTTKKWAIEAASEFVASRDIHDVRASIQMFHGTPA